MKFIQLLRRIAIRIPSRIFLLLGDISFIFVSVLGSYVLRLELGSLFFYYLPSAYWMIGVAIFIKPIIYYAFGLYRRLWAYASIQELKIIAVATTTASILVSLFMVALRTFNAFTGLPRAVLAIDWLLSLFLVGGLRFALRLLAEGRSTNFSSGGWRQTRRVLVVGAGDAGALVVREIQKNPQLNMLPVCFLDDNPNKQKQEIYGIPVTGTIEGLSRTISIMRIQEVIFAIPTAPGQVVRKVTEVCRQRNVPFRTMPGIYELIGGKVNVSRLREVSITDLLRRKPAQIDNQLIGASMGGRRVLVTGAGGSIGLELCRQIARWRPSTLLLLGHGENSVFETLMDLEEGFHSLPIHPIIADVRDIDRLTTVFDNLQPQVVFHAAAHKHVPLMEINVEEAITNNILGTRNLVDLSITYDVERLVMISSDKAIRPSSVMGATKRIAEFLILDAAHRTGRAFVAVRFGNVLGSRGSVVPHFKRQILKGGPVTVTHPDMERYFMTIPEAVHLVLQAAAMGSGGEVFVFKMGEQVRILHLAEDLIRLSGFEPGKDIEIVFTGIRPGEKLREELWDKWARYEPTSHPDIVLLKEEDILSNAVLTSAVNDLIHLAREGEPVKIMQRLDELIPGATVQSTPPPDLTSIV